MPEAVIVDRVRTPIGALGGALSGVRPDDLAAHALVALIDRTGIDPSIVEEVYLGCANQAGEDNRNVARMAMLLAGFPVDVAAVTFNRLCASGLNAINQAARAIRVGEGEVYISGGVKSMSRAHYSVPKAERPYPWGNLTMWDTSLGWRYPHTKMEQLHGTEAMGETAENICEQRYIFTISGPSIAAASSTNPVSRWSIRSWFPVDTRCWRARKMKSPWICLT